MRGFYDDFDLRPEHQPQYHHSGRRYDLEDQYGEFNGGSEGSSEDERAYERSYSERGFATIPPSHEEIVRHDPYQRSKTDIKFTVEPHELERHERGAFRDDRDSRYFTMHPKRPEYRDELEQRQYEHSRAHYDDYNYSHEMVHHDTVKPIYRDEHHL